MMSYSSSLYFVPVQWFLAELWPLDFGQIFSCHHFFFAMLGDIDLRVYDHKLQINFEIRSGWMIFDQLTAVGLWNLAKYSVVTTLFHYDFRYWLDFLVWKCIIISYRSTLKFILVEWFLANLQTFGLLLRELKKGETFASLLNIHGGDIRVVPTHLVSHLFDHSHKFLFLMNIVLILVWLTHFVQVIL
jgi:hypothetical protein